jgi:ABC-type multidrug transport system fused ATPase/permease subunit
VILPQAVRIAIPPTVGFLVQVIKGTALASVIGFIELTKAGTMITNATFNRSPSTACVALMYFRCAYPVSACYAKSLERKLHVPTDSPVVRSSRRPAQAYRRQRGAQGHRPAVQRGEVIAIIGKSGSGKSTLLRCINGLEVFQDGSLTVDGKPLLHGNPKAMRELRQHVGMIFQSFNLFPHLTWAATSCWRPRW